MNKKLSLMMAAFLAAGYSVTAEAGIVKVANANGLVAGSYVIAAGDLQAGNAMVLSGVGGELGAGEKAAADFTDATAAADYLFAFTASSSDWTLTQGSNGLEYTDDSQTFALASGAGNPVVLTAADADGNISLQAAAASSNKYYLDPATASTFSKNASTALFIYKVTNDLADADAGYFIAGGKVLVAYTNARSTSYDKAKFVSLAEVADYSKEQTQWVVENGIIKLAADKTNCQIADEDLALSASGSVISFDVTGNKLYIGGEEITSAPTMTGVPAAGEADLTGAIDNEITGAVKATVGNSYLLKVNESGNNIISQTGAAAATLVATGSEMYWTLVETSKKGVYNLKNGEATLSLGDETNFIIEYLAAGDNMFVIKSTKEADKYLKYSAGWSWDTNASASYFGFVEAETQAITVADLIKYEKDGFSVSLSYGDKKTLNENPFVGHLTTMKLKDDKTGFEAATTGATSLLKNSDGNYIVAYQKVVGGSGDNYYYFKTVSAEDLLKDLKEDTPVFLPYFSATASKAYDKDKLPALVSLSVQKASGAVSSANSLGYIMVDGKAYLATSTKTTDVSPINIKLGSTSVVKASDLLTDKFFRVVKIDKKNGNTVLGVQYDNTATGALLGKAAFVSDINGDLEDQWALTLTDNDTKYTFTNRETKEITFELTANQLYYGENDDEYVSGSDTYSIAPIENTKSEDGYLRLENVKNKRFNLGYWSDTYNAAAWFTENHKDVKKDNHVIGLDQENDPLVLAVVDFVGAKDTKKSIKSDSIYVVSELGYFDAKGEYKERLDTLKVVAYSFINQYNEPMKLATKVVNNEDAYVSVATPKYETLAEAIEAVRDDASVAQKFTLRKVGDKLNLRPVEFAEATDLYHKFSTKDVNKMYSGDTKNGILYNTEMYSRPENDRFVIEESNKPMYRTVTNELDTIAIYRQDNPADMMFEKGQFLGIANNVQFDKIAPAMVAELAYVDGEGHHPQYMLLVEPGIVEGGTWCPEHGLNSGCPHAEPFDGYTTGRYLVNLKDTAIVWNTDNHMKGNPYVNSENYYKLGFVQASHIGDSLIFNAVKPTAVDTVKMNTADYNVAKFSFRYVDNDEKSFVIETADYEKLDAAKEGEMKATYGYLKWMNDVVVVVSDIKDADVFNMDEEYAGNPTANEGINASSVSVIAGNGVVTINGAAGKKVVISNVLGQTIANAVLSSDNATISAPAGVVVVAVEGEAAVKAIVK